jgi:hypothetical protein
MNRAWMIRAEQRIERLERKIQELGAVIEALKPVAPVVAPAESAEPIKRGPGRPPKAAE